MLTRGRPVMVVLVITVTGVEMTKTPLCNMPIGDACL
jgi:hypothetical protein